MNSIRRQLARSLVGFMLLLSGGGVIALYLAAHDAATEQFDQALQAKALAISAAVINKTGKLGDEFNARFANESEDTEPLDFFEVWDASGRVVARSRSLGVAADLPHPSVLAAKPRIWNLKLPTGQPGRAIGFVFATIAVGPRLRADASSMQIVLASDRGDLDETLWSLVGIAVGYGVLLIAATLAIIPLVLRKGLQPVDVLSAQVAQIDANSLQTRFDVVRLPHELQPIAARFNDLLARLESSFERERRFSADLAHEFRTPLTELRSLAECALKWPEARDPATDRETLAIAEQMQRLVDHILALARTETGEITPSFETIAMDTLIRDVWRPFAAVAAEKQTAVTFVVSPVQCIADATLLRSIIVNLIDNAVEYTPRKGSIAIRAYALGGQAMVMVTNDAPALQESDVSRTFDRFWRKEAARTGGKHVGLGLSLARGFARAMGWNLSAQREAQRITFILSGPLNAVKPPIATAISQ